MAYQDVTYEKNDRIAYVTINRPHVHNALSPDTTRDLWDIWCDFRDDPDVWVAILTGAGDKAFCAGHDLKWQAEHPDSVHDPNLLPPGGMGGIVDRFECWKPMIAAVNGFALGGGFEIALACDLIIAAENAKFGLPEPRVGLMALGGGLHRLPRQIPLKLAMGMILSSRQFSAEECFRFGFINEIAPVGQAVAVAERWAKDILEGAPLAVQGSKQAAMEGLGWPFHIAFDRKYRGMERAINSEDWVEGPRAFGEKRKPVWKGR